MAKIIFGCGYLGHRIAARYRQWGETVYAVTRSASKGERLSTEGILPIVGDIVSGPLEIPRETTTAIISIGYDRGSSQPIGEVYATSVTNILASLPPTVRRVIYISSTGVFGRATGEWVDEETPAIPLRDGGKACLAAEDVLRTSPWASQTVILRLAGIYGPGRIPRRADLAAGRPIDAPPDGFLNLIHVDDAASISLLADQPSEGGQLFLVADGSPVLRRDYYTELASLVGGPPPNFVAPADGSPAAARASSDKRVSNRKLVETLGPTLAFPSYREGLASIVAAEDEAARS